MKNKYILTNFRHTFYIILGPPSDVVSHESEVKSHIIFRQYRSLHIFLMFMKAGWCPRQVHAFIFLYVFCGHKNGFSVGLFLL